MALGSSGSSDILTISTPTGSGSFLVLGLEGREELNRLPEYRVDVVGDLIPVVDKPLPIVVNLLLGGKAEVKMELHDEKRFFGGYVTRFAEGERHGRYRRYAITLRPWLWFATRTRNSKVFQKKSVKDIVDEVLSPYSSPSAWRLASAATYPKLDYCVQYDETDFDFVSRLLERAGINYFFEYDEGTQTLVFVDANSKFKSKSGTDPIRWADSLKYDATICDWRASQEVRSVKAVVHDHDYLDTATKIDGTKENAIAVPPRPKLGKAEVFEYPGDFVNNSQTDAKDAQSSSKASDRAKVLHEGLNSLASVCSARSNARHVAVGGVITVEENPESSQNGDYIVVSTSINAQFGQHEAISDLKGLQRDRQGFVASLVCAKKDGDAIRPEASTRKPTMRGPHTALVVGASGNEIETDKHGRIKVQFFWDRDGQKNQNSSCWVRVATPWASKNFGMISLPRVGDEVLVDFIDGDPDRPIVVGSVYNDLNPPIWELPTNATMSGIKTRTSKEGTADTANELRFEDKKDGEYIWLQAEKDFYRYVKRHAWDWIAENETRKTKKIRKEVIGETWNMDVGKDVMHNYGKDLHVTVAGDIFYKGGATWQIDLTKDLTVKVGGAFGYSVTGDTGIKSTGKLLLTSAAEVHVKGTTKVAVEGVQVSIKATAGVVLDCPAGVTLKCGGSLVALTPGGVDIVGPMVKINSGGGGGSGSAATEASDAKPAEAKKFAEIEPGKASDYDKTFEDPMKKK